GWGPQEDDATFHLLVPLKPPHGHAFRLELGTTEGMPAKYSCIRVERECSCKREQLAKDTPCFLHCHQEQLGKNRGPSIFDTICTGPYLDVEKTARWFQDMVKDAWVALPQSRHCHLKVLPAKRSCKLRLTDASNSTVFIYVMLGVQQGD
ncbi:IPIL1 protein, partial [Cepphus grylle]|nr:IPIL1 protein [Cepphus grylle]